MTLFNDDDHALFRSVRASSLARAFEEIVTANIDDDNPDVLTPEEAFRLAGQQVARDRQAKRISEAIRKARFPIMDASIAEIRYEQGRNLNPMTMKRLGNHDWGADPTNLLILSPTGSGKTYLTCAVGISACHNGYSVAYWRMDDLARRLAVTRIDTLEHEDMLAGLFGVDVLILDDFLTVGIDERTASDLFAILANRENIHATIIGSQSTPGHWLDVLPDKNSGDSIVNRLSRSSRKITLGTVDMREITSRERIAAHDGQ